MTKIDLKPNRILVKFLGECYCKTDLNAGFINFPLLVEATINLSIPTKICKQELAELVC